MGFLDALAAGDKAVGERLGEVVTYTPGTGSPVSVAGVYDAAYLLVDVGGQSGVSSTRPAVSLLLSDLPSDPKLDPAARVTIRTIVYKAWKVEPDGQGRTQMILQLA